MTPCAKSGGAKAPRAARTEKAILALKRSNVSTPKFWMLVEPTYVALCAQRRGEEATRKLTISRAAFDRFVDWYNTGKWTKP